MIIEVFIIIDSCSNSFGTHLFSQKRRNDIDVLILRRAYSYKEVRILYARFSENTNRSRITLYNQDIHIFTDVRKVFLTLIYDGKVVIFFIEHPCQMTPNLARSCYYNFHTLNC